MKSALRPLIGPVLYGLIIALGYIFIIERTSEPVQHEVVLIEKQFTEPAQQSTYSVSDPISYADAVSKAQPAVVNIATSKLVTERVHPLYEDPIFRRFFGLNQAPRRQRMQQSLGSGVIISPSGYILTNNHVIAEADQIKVGLADGREVEALVVGTDPETDLALIYIDIPDLPSITLANTDNIRIGDVVLAIGNPFGVGQTVTKGIVSALGRHQSDLSSFVDFIQTDAAINPGNSGGALINAYGDLIGINTAIYSNSGGSHGIGFAIPIGTATKVVKQLVQYGQVIRGWVGIEPQVLNPALANALNLPDIQGLLVVAIAKNGPAHQAGIRPGDIITHMNGNMIEDPRAAMEMISNMKPGAKVTIRVNRQNQPLDILVVVSARPTPHS
ncbi:MAG: 2-alkenal reductase [Pseudomonadales bacterium]|jgi:serine protease DegS|uniref:trypsin-like peptidase domain-containing protein n=1 Tax=unclassified Ketobacter TaxID=2639109 RepID=UPI000C4B659C|nr:MULTISPECIES: trypsin-like peptidase domain-containing protein [unclassified Ketobacter]MAA60888.1 2-alkenal reductase [Pseudomonadales bacterium]MEC8811096.1 trypsin-like peptidase domain-containing protein [Pseudomonadota bacterium]TNC88602.1 MAG: 2-alkenal reductase [Alcanivorax sp.]HAG95726.1 2-alkenal reductase [Gammaproteobacteria bacterium]MAQ25382.1 2-alkenal reductase [Pseudomonadales bacterium]|tara:strand:- start:19401 stop:20561 length:1161 start_codon:yes stop_codon:yes gene_type:complete